MKSLVLAVAALAAVAFSAESAESSAKKSFLESYGVERCGEVEGSKALEFLAARCVRS